MMVREVFTAMIKECKDFIKKNSLIPCKNAGVKLGLFYNNELVHVSPFKDCHNDIPNKEYQLISFSINPSLLFFHK